MSTAVFNPAAYIGLEWNTTRVPVWDSQVRRSVSGREYRTPLFSYPLYRYKMSYSVLRQGAANVELASLCGFFNQRLGDFDSFLFADPDDNTVTAQAIGLGDGSNRLYQLVRTFGSFVEPVYDVNGTPGLYVNGVLKTLTVDYTLSATGLVTFTAAPGAGLVVAWTGSYWRRVRFVQKQLDFTKFMANLWELKSLELISVKV